MENLIVSVNVVLPLFISISLGYFLSRIKLFDDHSLLVLNNVVFRVFLPILLFMNIYNTDIGTAINVKLLAFAVVAITVLFLIGLIVVPLIEKDPKRRGVLMQAVFRSNFVFFGIPITLSLAGEQGLGSIAVLVAVVVPMFNILAVVSLQMYVSGKINIKKALIGVCKNPLIIGSTLGIIALLLKIPFPSVVLNTANDISKMATPLALILLGGTFKFSSVRKGLLPLTYGVLFKLIITPLIFVPLSILMGFRGTELVGLMVLFAAPMAVSSFTMSQQMGSDGDLASQMVVFTSGFSIITVFLWVFALKQFNFI